MKRTPLERVRLGTVVLCLILIVSIVGYVVGGRTWLDALYMVVITVGTVGYGETSHLSSPEKIWTIGVIIFGISAAVFTMGGFFQMMAEGEIERALHSGRNWPASSDLAITSSSAATDAWAASSPRNSKPRNNRSWLSTPTWTPSTKAKSQGLLALHGDATAEELLQTAGIKHQVPGHGVYPATRPTCSSRLRPAT